MKVIITGSNGFIGAFIKNECLNKGYEVIELNREKGFDLSKKEFSEDIKSKNVDYIFHFAQSNQYRNFPDEVEDIYNVNCNSTLELLEWGRNNGIKKFILASTGNVYKSSKQPLKEIDKLEPNGFYGSSKLIAEELTKNYSLFFDIQILRIFGCYGPGQKNMLIPNMINNVRENKEISLAEGAGLYINPIYIDDFVKIFFQLLQIEQKNRVEVFNIGGDKIYSLFDIVDIISNELKIKAKFRFNDNEASYLVGDISKMNSNIDKFTFTTLEKNIKLMVNNV